MANALCDLTREKNLDDDDDDDDDSLSAGESPVKSKEMFETPADERISSRRVRGETGKFTAVAFGSEKSVDNPK